MYISSDWTYPERLRVIAHLGNKIDACRDIREAQNLGFLIRCIATQGAGSINANREQIFAAIGKEDEQEAAQ